MVTRCEMVVFLYCGPVSGFSSNNATISPLLLHCSIFQAHEMVRSEILEQIFNRVVTKATSPVTHYLGRISFFHLYAIFAVLSGAIVVIA